MLADTYKVYGAHLFIPLSVQWHQCISFQNFKDRKLWNYGPIFNTAGVWQIS